MLAGIEGKQRGCRVRGQGSEVRGQRSEVRGQRSEVRSQRSEVRRQRSEGTGQKAEVRRQRAEVRVPQSDDPFIFKPLSVPSPSEEMTMKRSESLKVTTLIEHKHEGLPRFVCIPLDEVEQYNRNVRNPAGGVPGVAHK